MVAFDKLIKKLENELRDLKISSRKSAGTVEMTERLTEVRIGLSLSAGVATGAKHFKVASSSGNLLLASATINKSPTESDGRSYECEHYWDRDDGADIVLVSVIGSNSDVEALNRGESVTVSVNLNVVATDNFSITEV